MEEDKLVEEIKWELPDQRGLYGKLDARRWDEVHSTLSGLLTFQLDIKGADILAYLDRGDLVGLRTMAERHKRIVELKDLSIDALNDLRNKTRKLQNR